jgi:hypothetical protein
LATIEVCFARYMKEITVDLMTRSLCYLAYLRAVFVVLWGLKASMAAVSLKICSAKDKKNSAACKTKSGHTKQRALF